MKREEIVSFLEHIIQRQEKLDPPDVFQFKTVKITRKGTHTLEDIDAGNSDGDESGHGDAHAGGADDYPGGADDYPGGADDYPGGADPLTRSGPKIAKPPPPQRRKSKRKQKKHPIGDSRDGTLGAESIRTVGAAVPDPPPRPPPKSKKKGKNNVNMTDDGNNTNLDADQGLDIGADTMARRPRARSKVKKNINNLTDDNNKDADCAVNIGADIMPSPPRSRPRPRPKKKAKLNAVQDDSGYSGADSRDCLGADAPPPMGNAITDDLIDPLLLEESRRQHTSILHPISMDPQHLATVQTAIHPGPTIPPTSRRSINTADDLALQEAERYITLGKRSRIPRTRNDSN